MSKIIGGIKQMNKKLCTFIALSSLGTLPAQAALTTYTDSSFLTSDWSETVTFTRGTSRNINISQGTDNGNPGAYRRFTQTYSSGSDPAGADIVVYHESNQFNLRPSVLGNIFNINVSMDARVFLSPSSQAIAFGITFLQTGLRHSFGLNLADVPLNSGSNAILISQPGWHPFNFSNLTSDLTGAGFDLSNNGNDVLVGFFTSNGTASGSASSTGGIDNYSITIEHSNANAVPVPTSIWLFSSGLFGLFSIARRKINQA